MWQVKVGNTNFSVEQTAQGTFIDGKLMAWDFVETSPRHYSIIVNGESHTAELDKIDESSKTVWLKINGKLLEIAGKDRYDLLLEKMGMRGAASKKINDLKAPMPGLIVSVLVKEGDTVKKGDKLVILEAMKMENVLKAAGDAVVKAVKVQAKENVDKNHVLISFE